MEIQIFIIFFRLLFGWKFCFYSPSNAEISVHRSKLCISCGLLLNILIKHKNVIRYWSSRKLTFPGQSPAALEKPAAYLSAFFHIRRQMRPCGVKVSAHIQVSHTFCSITPRAVGCFVSTAVSFRIIEADTKGRAQFEGLDFEKLAQPFKESFSCC